MQTTNAAGGRGASPVANLWRTLYATRWAAVSVLLFALAAWGTWDSFHDGDGERLWGAMFMLAPAALAGGALVSSAWRPGPSAQALSARFLLTGALAAVPLVLLNVVFLIVAWSVPANRAAVAGYPGYHSWWDGGLGLQIVLVGLGGWIGGMLGALFVFIVIVLPILSIRRPGLVAAGSHLERIADGRTRSNAVAFVCIGLAVCVVGLILMAVTEGLGGLEDLTRRIGLMLDSGFYLDWGVWILGWAMFAGGLLVMAYPVARVALLRLRAALRGPDPAAREPVVARGTAVDREPDVGRGPTAARRAGTGRDASDDPRRRRRSGPLWPLIAGPVAALAGFVMMSATGSPGGVADFVIVVRHLGSAGFGAGAFVWAGGWLLVAAGLIVLAYGGVRVVAGLARREPE
ncbi:hypothetical protein [Zhihengliuella sp.]|uniref:hypothetical protein n=1 Tax=Zhihengliuella sp. TaxID=1954483 RepID=UPI0028121455|nr:hypothetical protein [Zhihengliuella sp.]